MGRFIHMHGLIRCSKGWYVTMRKIFLVKTEILSRIQLQNEKNRRFAETIFILQLLDVKALNFALLRYVVSDGTLIAHECQAVQAIIKIKSVEGNTKL
jgi:hypothetical protein